VLATSEYNFKPDSNTPLLHLTISENMITLNGEEVKVDQITSVLKEEADPQAVVLARIDRAQPMSLIRDVHQEFRKANHLKFIYVGQSPAGEQVNVSLMLPPFPGNDLPAIDDEYARENNMDMLKIQMGDNPEPSIQQKVYDFVKG